MTAYIALLRAVNVGGTGKLPMRDLKALCEAAGFRSVTTYIASGNVVFASDAHEGTVKATLEAALADYAGKAIPVMVRTRATMDAVRDANPFPGHPGNRVIVLFLDDAPPSDAADTARHKADDEEIVVGRREIYVRYGHGMGQSKLAIPAARNGTARNMNTVAKLCALAAAI